MPPALNQMTPENALQILAQAAAAAEMNLDDHNKAQAALQTLGQYIAQNRQAAAAEAAKAAEVAKKDKEPK